MNAKKALCDLERTILRQHIYLAKATGDKYLLFLHRLTTRTLLVNLDTMRIILERGQISNIIGGGMPCKCNCNLSLCKGY